MKLQIPSGTKGESRKCLDTGDFRKSVQKSYRVRLLGKDTRGHEQKLHLYSMLNKSIVVFTTSKTCISNKET